MSDALIQRLAELADELDRRYIDGDGKPITSEYQRGRCAGYSYAGYKLRLILNDRETPATSPDTLT